MDGSVDGDDALGARELMQAIDVLRHDEQDVAVAIFLENSMGEIRFRVLVDHARPIEIVKEIRVLEKEAMGKDGLIGDPIAFRRLGDAFFRPEIRDARGGGNPCSA